VIKFVMSALSGGGVQANWEESAARLNAPS